MSELSELFKLRKALATKLQETDSQIEALLEQEDAIRVKTMNMKLNDCIGNCGRKTRSKEQLCKICSFQIRT